MTLDEFFDEETVIDYENSTTFLSKSCGQESKALLVKLKHDAEFRKQHTKGTIVLIMSNTGNEHPTTYDELWGETLQIAQSMGVDLYFVSSKKKEDFKAEERFIKPGIWLNGEHFSDETFHTDSWTSLDAKYRQNSTCGSPLFKKTCTDGLKIQPIYKFVEWYLILTYPDLEYNKRNKNIFYAYRKKYGMIRMMIGFSAGEEGRRRKPQLPFKWIKAGRKEIKVPNKSYIKWFEENIKTTYPLIDIGMDRKGTQDYLVEMGYTIPLPSNCMKCPFTTHRELLWLDMFERDEFDEWVVIEANKLIKYADKGKKNRGVFGKLNKDGTPYTLVDALAYAKKRYKHMSPKAIQDWKMSHGHCVTSQY
ncbi:hypothetical protein LCGC14_0175550 [marine sediment metagenome]|uniref:Phosphoadenosine phosphosulphate reductase domain-containing protein n=1 Tax=marine sediment metagenome TaxID=412755 RepID=A0A0F9X9M2_9ZZZZ